MRTRSQTQNVSVHKVIQNEEIKKEEIKKEEIKKEEIKKEEIKKEEIKRVQFDVNIDFDDAANAWNYNKKSIGNGSYKYICTKLTKGGKKCDKSCYNINEYCKQHYKNI